MATVGNERYLRHIWLLCDGGLLILRGIVSREASICGQPFETFLAGNRSQFNNLFDVQRLKLFPDHSTVNTDTKTWDMSLLIIVVKRLFGASLSLAERISIKTLKTCRDELKAHPHCMSMTASDYSSSTNLLKSALCQLASGLSSDTNTQLQEIIKSAESETIDIKSALQHITELNEFKESFLQELEKSVSQVTSEIQKVHSSVNILKDDIATIGKDQLVRHHQLSAGMQELTVAAKKSQEDISEIKDLQERQNVMTKKILGFFIKRQAVEKAKRATVKELQIIIQMNCEDQEKREKATDLLLSTVRLIQNEHDFSEEEVKTMIHQRIEWRGELGVQLIEDVIDWFTDIDEVPDSSLGFAYKGSIRIPIQCFSKYGIYTQIYYMSSYKCLRRLSGISSTLTKLLGFLVFITCSEASDPFTDVLKEQSKTSESKTIVLPFQCKSDHGLADIQKTLGKKNKHTMKMSKTLSDIFDAKITLNTFMEKDKLPTSMYKSTMSLPSYESKKMMDSSHSPLDLEGMPLVSFERRKKMESSKAHLDKELYASNFGDRPLLTRSFPWQSHFLSASASLQMRKKEGRQETSLLLVGTYSIVREKTDVYVPHIFALKILPQEGFILIDRNNSKLKKLDKDFKTVSVYGLSETPRDVCYIDGGKIAVSLEWIGILFADVSGIIKIEKIVHLNIVCRSLAFFGNTLYIGDDEARIFTCTFGDEKPRLLCHCYKPYMTSMFPWYLAVSQSGEKIYMAYFSGITTINAHGKQLATLQYDMSCNASDICVINDGTILVSDLHSNNVIQINSEGTEVLRTFTLQNLRPVTLCYDKQECRLIVVGLDSDVHVYKLPAM